MINLIANNARHDHPGFGHGMRGVCRLLIVRCSLNLGGAVAIVAEPDDNPGPSVTNSAERIHEQLHQMHRIRPLILVEHYPHHGDWSADTWDRRPTLDHVWIDVDGSPQWTNVDPDALLATIHPNVRNFAAAFLGYDAGISEDAPAALDESV